MNLFGNAIRDRDGSQGRVEGWWNYGYDFTKHGICTHEQFDVALGRTPRPEDYAHTP